jgi:hypothetical protein
MILPFRARRAVFWCLGTERIVAAALSRGEREPLLEGCAASYAAPLPGACFAAGVLEVSWTLEAHGEVHVAALAAPYCRVEEGGPQIGGSSAWRRRRDAGEETAAGERVGVVRGARGLRACADETAVAQAAALFRQGRLRLVALDCEQCALASLADALGSSDADAARRQALSAVAVMPEAETAAAALGDDLAVPVGLALAWFAGGRGRAR